MFRLVFILICLTLVNSESIFKLATEITVQDVELPTDRGLQVQGIKKLTKAIVEQITLRNCSGAINELTFKQFPKLSKLTVWKSNVKEVNTFLPVTRLLVVGSHFPNLNSDLQQKLPNLQSAMFIGNKNFEVNPLVLKNFENLKALQISEANFTENCITKDWFKGLENLQELGLSDNNINCVAEDAFNSVSNLRKLDLTYNHIASLEKKLFKKLTKLEELGLYENDFVTLDLDNLASQQSHLEELGVSWKVLKNSNISAEDILKSFPKLKHIFFGHEEMPDDFKAGVFCQTLRQSGVECEMDNIFGICKILGY